MGDKSPKSVRRHATQKQAKSNAVNEKKRQAIAAKQAVIKKSVGIVGGTLPTQSVSTNGSCERRGHHVRYAPSTDGWIGHVHHTERHN